MPKNHKTKKPAHTEKKSSKEEVKKPEVTEEAEAEKEGGTLSDGVLDAFEEVAPADALVEEDTLVVDDDDDELDSGDYGDGEEW